MEKLWCTLGIIIFIWVTILVMTTDIGTIKHTIRFSNQNLAINTQEETTILQNTANVQNKNTKIETAPPKINNKKISYQNANFDLETKELYSSNVQAGINGSINNRNTSIKQSDINNLKAGLKPASTYKSKDWKYNNKNPNVIPQNTNINNNSDYMLKNIDWRVWRSNFVNKITDDTFYIPELNKYPTGTMFHYYFTVDNTGRVYNVRVTSLNISKEDREKIADLIRGYSYTDITRFPQNSKRKTATISAILLFSNETEYSTPGDFHDLEQVKIKL